MGNDSDGDTRRIEEGRGEGGMVDAYPAEVEAAMISLYQFLSERDRRLYAAVEALKLGRGGNTYIAKVFGCSRATILRGIKELREGQDIPTGRIRRPGGGRKRTIDKIENIDEIFLSAIDAESHRDGNGNGNGNGDGTRWTSMTLRGIHAELRRRGVSVSIPVIKQLMRRHGIRKRTSGR